MGAPDSNSYYPPATHRRQPGQQRLPLSSSSSSLSRHCRLLASGHFLCVPVMSHFLAVRHFLGVRHFVCVPVY